MQIYYLCAEVMQIALVLITRAAACHHPPSHRSFSASLRLEGADFHLSCVTLNFETAPVHMGTHGPVKPNGQHHLQAVKRKQLPRVKDCRYLWDLFTSDDKKEP